MYETLEGKHIRLRKAREDDWQSMLAHVWSDEAVYRWMLFQPTLTEEDARDRARRSAVFQQDHPAWFIALADTDEAIGYCGMKEVGPGHFEECGICLGTAWQGLGFGTEAVGLMLDLAFLHLGAEDFRYSYFQGNEALKALAEHFGFVYDHSYEITRPWDGTTFVSDSCLLTRAEYMARRGARRGPAIRLEEVTPDNWRADLHVRPDQQRFVASREGTLARAFAYWDRRSQAFIIMADEEPVGMAMYYDSPQRNAYYFSEFFIDERHQGRGFGRAAARLVLERMRAEGRYPKVFLCYVEGNEPARLLYEGLGFRQTGEADGDEIIMELDLELS